MERANNAVFRDIIDVCTSLRIKPLMGLGTAGTQR
jgi:hypothetical protein